MKLSIVTPRRPASGRRVLITGASGTLGRELGRRLVSGASR